MGVWLDGRDARFRSTCDVEKGDGVMERREARVWLHLRRGRRRAGGGFLGVSPAWLARKDATFLVPTPFPLENMREIHASAWSRNRPEPRAPRRPNPPHCVRVPLCAHRNYAVVPLLLLM